MLRDLKSKCQWTACLRNLKSFKELNFKNISTKEKKSLDSRQHCFIRIDEHMQSVFTEDIFNFNVRNNNTSDI